MDIKGLLPFFAKNGKGKTRWEQLRGAEGQKEEAQRKLLLETWDPKDLEELSTKGENSGIRLEATKRWVRVGLKGDKAKWLALSSKDQEIRTLAINLLSEGKTQSVGALADITYLSKNIGDAILATRKLILIATQEVSSNLKGEEKKKTEGVKNSALYHLEMIAVVSPKEAIAKPCFDALFTEGKIKAKSADSMSKEARCPVVRRAAASLLRMERD